MHKLEKHSFDECDWQDYVELFREFWQGNEQQIHLLERLKGNQEIAIVVNGINPVSNLNWIESKIPALDELSIIDCLQNENLIKRLKVMLMRMH